MTELKMGEELRVLIGELEHVDIAVIERAKLSGYYGRVIAELLKVWRNAGRLVQFAGNAKRFSGDDEDLIRASGAEIADRAVRVRTRSAWLIVWVVLRLPGLHRRIQEFMAQYDALSEAGREYCHYTNPVLIDSLDEALGWQV